MNAVPARPDESSEDPVLIVDALGRPCPVPVIELARALERVEVGQVLAVRADDPAAAVDVPAWCRMRGQQDLGTRTDTAPGTLHVVRRRA